MPHLLVDAKAADTGEPGLIAGYTVRQRTAQDKAAGIQANSLGPGQTIVVDGGMTAVV